MSVAQRKVSFAAWFSVTHAAFFDSQIKQYIETACTRILPTFGDLEKEAENVSEREYEKLGQHFGPDQQDPADFAEEALERGVDYYVVMSHVAQGVRNLLAAGLYRVLQVQPTPPRFTYIGSAGQPGMIRLTFTTVSGGTYRLQYRQHLRLGAWAPLDPDLIATGTTLTSEQSTQGLAQCLYRVLLVRP